MLHYLFTNDIRREKWPDILAEYAQLINNDCVPTANEDKSQNNVIHTLLSYLCIQKGSKANELCRNGHADAVILNFINRFQFPNARTAESFRDMRNDKMSVAPLRLAVQLLFALNLIDRTEAHVSYAELAKYIICNSNTAKGNGDILTLVREIVTDRRNEIDAPPVPDTDTLHAQDIEWKHCPRQIRELFALLQFVPFVEASEERFDFVMPDEMDAEAAKMFFHIVNNREMWEPPQSSDWKKIRESYQTYLDSGLAFFTSANSLELKRCSPRKGKDLKEEYKSWLKQPPVSKSSGTAEQYACALNLVCQRGSQINTNSWKGLYEALYGHLPEQDIFQISSFGQLLERFSALDYVINGLPQGLQSCRKEWEESDTKPVNLPPAWNFFKEFMKWRDEQCSSESVQPQDKDSSPAACFLIENKQIAYYGVPGSGKSFQVNADIDKILDGKGVEKNKMGQHKIRCVFHPDYSNADFVGQILPVISDKEVKYQFRPGPLATILYRALHDPSKPYFLIIEEINRGNAAAIFGELFQLLDRIKDGEEDSSTVNTYGPGWSAYDVENIDLNAYIRRGDPNDPDSVTNTDVRSFGGGIEFSHDTAIRLPPNLSIYATMNTSDQNVFAMDNAFQRRFGTKLIRNKLEDASQYNIEIEGTGVYWGAFREWINKKILAVPGLSKAEDKQLGGWFISTPKKENGERAPISRNDFAEKALKYLWNDVFKRDSADSVFKKADGQQTLSEIVDAFETENEAQQAFQNVFKLSGDEEGLLKKKLGEPSS